jgi:hydroxyacylglutathione hydrolase
VLIEGFPAGSFAANCYVIAPDPGEDCLIIDPGEDAAAGIEEIVAKHKLRPVAALATHGHIDHIWSIAPVCDNAGIPAYIHPADRELLTDPAKGLSLVPGQQLFGGLTLSEPADVLELSDGMRLELAGIKLVVDHAPGHTPGSVAFRLDAELVTDEADGAVLTPGDTPLAGGHPRTPDGPKPPAGALFTGDLLFAGSIGRTDLPGGDYETILDSLARVCLPLPDGTVVLSGHGPLTTIGAERASNPFLAGLAPKAGPVRGL